MTYQHWFTFTITHEYFTNSICPVFNIVPTHDTYKVFKNFDIKCQLQQQQLLIYAKVRPSKSIAQELQTASDLFLQLIPTDNNFSSYTKLPSNKTQDNLIYVTNSNPSTEEVVPPTTIVSHTPLRFTVTTKNVQHLSVKNMQGATVFEQSTANTPRTTVDLRALGTGRYDLWLDGKLSKSFLGTTEPLHERCFGIVHLQMQHTVDLLKTLTLPALTLHFESKATYWEYLVVVPQDKKINLKRLEIAPDLYKPKTETLFQNKTAYVFVSQQPLKLVKAPQQYSILKLQYTHQFSDTIEEQDIKLPVPAANATRQTIENNENIYYSRTIIYV